MSDTLIKIGDIVFIKSHPKYPMTVESVEGGMAYLVWFHPTTHDFQRQRLNMSSLCKM